VKRRIALKTLKGIVKGNTVVLEQGAALPDGTEVEVRPLRSAEELEKAFAGVRANRIDRYVGIEEIIEDDKREREERIDSWFQ